MAKRWRHMSEDDRQAWILDYTRNVGAVLRTFAEDDQAWPAFVTYVESVGDYLSAVNAVSAFGQHRAHNVAKVSDLRTWTEWLKAGRTPRAGRKVTVFTAFPLHLWDVADTDVTDRKAWRKASPAVCVGDGAMVLSSMADTVWQSYGVDVNAAPPADILDEPSPADRERARLRGEGYTGSLDAMLREEWSREVERLHDVAEGATRGHMRNKRGLAKDVSTRELLRNRNTASAYASEELTAWFAANGGVPTFAAHKAQALGERAPRQTFEHAASA